MFEVLSRTEDAVKMCKFVGSFVGIVAGTHALASGASIPVCEIVCGFAEAVVFVMGVFIQVCMPPSDLVA